MAARIINNREDRMAARNSEGGRGRGNDANDVRGGGGSRGAAAAAAPKAPVERPAPTTPEGVMALFVENQAQQAKINENLHAMLARWNRGNNHEEEIDEDDLIPKSYHDHDKVSLALVLFYCLSLTGVTDVIKRISDLGQAVNNSRIMRTPALWLPKMMFEGVTAMFVEEEDETGEAYAVESKNALFLRGSCRGKFLTEFVYTIEHYYRDLESSVRTPIISASWTCWSACTFVCGANTWATLHVC